MLCDAIDIHFLSMEKSYVFSWGIRVDGKTREVCVGVINTEFCSVATSFRKQGERVAIRESNRNSVIFRLQAAEWTYSSCCNIYIF